MLYFKTVHTMARLVIWVVNEARNKFSSWNVTIPSNVPFSIQHIITHARMCHTVDDIHGLLTYQVLLFGQSSVVYVITELNYQLQKKFCFSPRKSYAIHMQLKMISNHQNPIPINYVVYYSEFSFHTFTRFPARFMSMKI